MRPTQGSERGKQQLWQASTFPFPDGSNSHRFLFWFTTTCCMCVALMSCHIGAGRTVSRPREVTSRNDEEPWRTLDFRFDIMADLTS